MPIRQIEDRLIGITVLPTGQDANTVLAGPTSGSPGVSTMRHLVAADIPDISGSYDPAGSAATAQANAEAYADTKDVVTLASAEAYADAGDATTLSSAHTYADTKDAITLASAHTYSDTGDAATLVSAEAYADGKGANPSASVGLAAVNGVATTYLRSDGAPALSQSIVPTWTGIHTFSNKAIFTDGSASAPALQLGTNLTGLYATTGSPDTVCVAANGLGIAQFSTNGSGVARMTLGADESSGSSVLLIEASVGGAGSCTMDARSTGTMQWRLTRASSDTTGVNYSSQKARGTILLPTAVLTNDRVGNFLFLGYDGVSTYREAANITATVIAATPSATAMTGQLTLNCTNSGLTRTEVARFEVATGFSMFGANPVIDQNRVFRPLTTTVAGVPAVTATGIVEFSDESSHSAIGYTDGTSWRRVGDNQVASATVDYRGIWSNLSARYPQTALLGGGMTLNVIQTTYDRLNAAGLLAKLTGLWVHCMQNQADALLNWITPGTRNMTITGSPVFTANVGFTGDGSTALLNSGGTSANFSVTQNSATYGAYVVAASASAASVIGKSSSTRNIYMQSASSGTINARCNDATNDAITPSSYIGLHTMTRGASANYQFSVDDGAQTTVTRTSTSPTSGNITYLGTTDTTGSEFSTAQIAFSFVGTNLSLADIANLRAILVDYMLVQVGVVTASVANLPPAANFKGATFYVPDLGGGAGLLQSDATNWFRTSGGYEVRSLATGSETIKYLTNAEHVVYNQTLSGNVTVTLSGTDAKGTTVKKGARFIIAHNNATPGAFTFTVNDGPSSSAIITFGSATNKSAIFVFDGTNWQLMLDSAI